MLDLDAFVRHYVDVESFDSLRGFLGDPRYRGVSGVRLVVSDAHAGLRRAVEEVSAIDPRAGRLLEDAREDALAYLSFPAEHHLKIRTNNVQERVNHEIKRGRTPSRCSRRPAADSITHATQRINPQGSQAASRYPRSPASSSRH